MEKLANYKVMLNKAIEDFKKGKPEKIRPISETGKFRYAKYSVDKTDKYTEYLDICNVDYIIGNDSPKGGKLGKYILITAIKEN